MFQKSRFDFKALSNNKGNDIIKDKKPWHCEPPAFLPISFFVAVPVPTLAAKDAPLLVALSALLSYLKS